MAIVYVSKARDRYFLVPTAEAIAPGDFEVQSIDGAWTKLDGLALARFEVPEAEAQAVAERRVAILRGVVRELTAFAAALQGAATTLETDVLPSWERVDRVLALVGATRAELARDPQGTMKTIADRLRRATQEKLLELVEDIR